MDIQQVIYSSRPVPSLTMDEVNEIVASSQTWNQQRDVTGRLLVVTDASADLLAFMQWIEGPKMAIQACLKRIIADPRHTAIHIVQNAQVSERSYPGWSMHQEVLTAEAVEDALGAVGISGHIDTKGIIVVEGEIVQGDEPPQT
ncbi:MAG: hypothetical protein Rubg2KO_12240 [Rubricoccaceae bacterium]